MPSPSSAFLHVGFQSKDAVVLSFLSTWLLLLIPAPPNPAFTHLSTRHTGGECSRLPPKANKTSVSHLMSLSNADTLESEHHHPKFFSCIMLALKPELLGSWGCTGVGGGWRERERGNPVQNFPSFLCSSIPVFVILSYTSTSHALAVHLYTQNRQTAPSPRDTFPTSSLREKNL